VAVYPLGSYFCSSRELTNDTGLAASLISSMRGSLSMRGMTRRWWKLEMMDTTTNPESAS
jgi:hypothetical protein